MHQVWSSRLASSLQTAGTEFSLRAASGGHMLGVEVPYCLGRLKPELHACFGVQSTGMEFSLQAAQCGGTSRG